MSRPPFNPPKTGGDSPQAARKPVQTKLSREFTAAVSAFQRVQRLSAEKQRYHVESQKRRVEELVEDDAAHEEPRSSVELERVQVQQQEQIQQQQQWVSSFTPFWRITGYGLQTVQIAHRVCRPSSEQRSQ